VRPVRGRSPVVLSSVIGIIISSEWLDVWVCRPGSLAASLPGDFIKSFYLPEPQFPPLYPGGKERMQMSAW
jgi:hypothetical protein